MVTVSDIEGYTQAAKKAFESHANAMRRLIRDNRSLTIEMCRWMSMNVSVFDDVAMALAIGAADPDQTLQGRVKHALAALRDSSPDLALVFETALMEGLRAAILLRLARVDGATENGRRVLRTLLDDLSGTLVVTGAKRRAEGLFFAMQRRGDLISVRSCRTRPTSRRCPQRS